MAEVEADAMNRTVKIIQEFNYTSDRHNDRFFTRHSPTSLTFSLDARGNHVVGAPHVLYDSFSITRS